MKIAKRHCDKGDNLKMKETGKIKCYLKKFIACFLCFALMFSMSMVWDKTEEVCAEETPGAKKTITGLGIGSISKPEEPIDKTSTWKGSYIYFGTYGTDTDGNPKPVRYRVLDPDTTEFSKADTDGNKTHTMFVDCDETLFTSKFDTTSNKWDNSLVWQSLNGENGIYNTSFSKVEKEAISGSYKKNVSGSALGLTNVESAGIDNEKIFVLDIFEASNKAYGYFDGYDYMAVSKSRIKSGASNYWWLRSYVLNENRKTNLICYDGDIYNNSIISNYGVSPAFNIDLESVLFSSLVSGEAGKSDAEYKLTLKDDDISIKLQDNNKVYSYGTYVVFPYTITGNDKDKANRISVLITDDEYTPGKSVVNTDENSKFIYLKADTGDEFYEKGIGSFTLPSKYLDKVCGKDYHVYILVECVNKEKETDYASVPLEVDMPEFTYYLGATEPSDTITVPYSDGSVNNQDNKVVLKIKAPELKAYGDTNSEKATLEGLENFNTITGLNISEGDISYVGRNTTVYSESNEAPTSVGEYTAKILIKSISATAKIDYEIKKASQAAPSVRCSDETTAGYNDGRIYGLTVGMEISTESEDTGYVAYTENMSTYFAPGRYYVRYRGDSNHEPSSAAVLVIYRGKDPEPVVTPEPEFTSVTEENKDGSVTTTTKDKNDDGTVTQSTVREWENGDSNKTEIVKDSEGNVISSLFEIVRVSKKGTRTENIDESRADGYHINSSVKTYKSGKTISSVSTTFCNGAKQVYKETKNADGTMTRKVMDTNTKGKSTLTVTTVARNESTDGEDTSDKLVKTVAKYKVTGEGKIRLTSLKTEGDKVIIPKTVTFDDKKNMIVSLGKNLFKGMEGIKEIYIYAENLKKIYPGAFEGVPAGAKFYIKATTANCKKIARMIKRSGFVKVDYTKI